MKWDSRGCWGSAKRTGVPVGLSTFQQRALMAACTVLLVNCGGGGDQENVVDGSQPPVTQPPVVQARCTMNSTAAASFEEQRLPNKLRASDARSFSEQLLQASGFDRFGSEFSVSLCKEGLSGASTYDEAVTLVKAEGQKLWQAAIDRVQGRKVEGTLPQSDDRMLYWARLTMTKVLRQWAPDFPLDDAQRVALQNEFERASRGQYAIDFPEGSGYKRILVSGFDPFTLGNPGVDGNLNIRIGNPSGATILSLDGHTLALADGTTAVIRTFVLPVNYGPFIDGMQEDTLGPWFKSGAKRVDASITISQGGNDFNLEHFNGRYHLASIPGNDNVWPTCSGGRYPATDDCDIHPPQRWLGYASKPWKRDMPPQFIQASLPFQKMIDANTGSGIFNPVSGSSNGWAVVRNDSYSMGPCTKAADDAQKAYDAAKKAVDTALAAYLANPTSILLDQYFAANAALSSTPVPSPLEINCAKSGGGGNYLSNASAYRNTLMRDLFGLNIPAGHIHTPVMTRFNSGSDGLITDVRFEGLRDGIVAQTRKLVEAVAMSLVASSNL